MEKRLRRISVMLEADLEKKLRIIQAREITKRNGQVSFSQTINDQLRKSLKS